MPWDPVPGGGPRPLPPPDVGASRRSRSRAPRTYAGAGAAPRLELAGGLAGWWPAGSASPGRARGWSAGCAGRGGCGCVLGGRRSCRWSAGWPPCRSPSLPTGAGPRLRAVHAGLAGWLRDVAWSSWAVNVVGDLDRAAGAGRLRAPLARAGGPPSPAVLPPALVLLGSFVYPVLVEPLFNTFTPLPDGPLRTGVLAAGRRRGRAGRRRAGGRRVAAYDDPQRLRVGLRQHPAGGALRQPGRRRAATTQALSVVAHELAHARHDDVLTGSLLGAAGARARASACSAWLVAAAVGGTRAGMQTTAGIRRWCRWCWPWWRWRRCWRARCRTRSAGRSRPGPTSTRCGPRDDPEAFVEVQRQLALRSLADPTPPAWSQFWFGSHPTTLSGSRSPGGCRTGRRRDSSSRRPCSGRSSCRCREQVREDAWPKANTTTDDQGGDAGDQQAVLDGGGAALVPAAAGCASVVTRSSRPCSRGE